MVHQDAELAADSKGVVALIGATQDVTELRVAERQIRRLAYFDDLTGLPNRASLHRYLDRAISEARRHAYSMAVLVADLDLFKRVNDTLGHAAGDALLREAAERVSECIRGGDVVARASLDVGTPPGWAGDSMAARMGGDEFVIVLSRIRRPEDAATVARRIAAALAKPFLLGQAEVFISSSIGIATYPEAGADPEVLLEKADAAMYHAKDLGRNGFQFFSEVIQQRSQVRSGLENRLRGAIARLAPSAGGAPAVGETAVAPEFALHYQPKISPVTGAVCGVEALLRWSPPDHAPISPADFIPIAEDTGLIIPLGDWVLREACRQGAQWARHWTTPVRVAVNISARQFREPSFVESVATISAAVGLDPRHLELEITEHCVMQDVELSARVLRELKELGVSIALDDFGTGYSSLSYLTTFPIDILKIDRSFIKGIGCSSRSDAE